ncbi:copper chaperone PCu(A)C [Brevundimonas sp.]|uniref:copper chaperone PCu(A)C n=1 Tax=Brevundimonas sp. TaxID=1871086 RepID=UPI0035B1C656
MKYILIAAASATLAACSAQPENATLAVVEATDAVCRPTPNGRDITGCYVTLTASQADRLVTVASPSAGTAEIHEMKTEGGIMKMAELPNGLALPAGEAVSLKPGGNHIMLMQVKSPLAAGDTVSLTLTFEKASPLGVRAAVGQPAPAGGHTGH